MLITAPLRNENESVLFYEVRPEQQEGIQSIRKGIYVVNGA